VSDGWFGGLRVSLLAAGDRARFDVLLDEHHWLGHRMVGETLRYVATDADGRWVALVGFGSSALSCRPRDRYIGWSSEIQFRRLGFVASNQRFCVLPEGRRPNVASAVMSRTLARLSSDWVTVWGHPVLLVETFVDRSRHVGTCYSASSFVRIGQTAGYGRRSGRYVEHGQVKDVYVKTLHRRSVEVLAGPFDHPLLSADPRSCVTSINFNTADLSSLLGVLRTITDPRKPRGVRHDFASTLALCACATLAGNKSLLAISEFASAAPQEILARVGARVSPVTGHRVPPSYATIRRALDLVDPQELDDIVNQWAATQHRLPPHAQHDNGSDTRDRGDGRDDTGDHGDGLCGIAVDGKTLRGARKTDGTRVHLLSAVTHDTKTVVGQRDVNTDKTNEIKVFRPLVARLDITGKVITADPMHAQRKAARFIVGFKSGHYLLGVKANQPAVYNAGVDALDQRDLDRPHHETIQRGHGRIDRHRVWVAPIPAGTRFPHACQLVLVERESSNLHNELTSIETRIYVTDLTAHQANPANLLRLAVGHWSIESHHWIRDVTYGEDLSQIRVGATPRVMATLRNLAISIIRHTAGITTSIAAATRQLARQPNTTLDLLGIPALTPRLCTSRSCAKSWWDAK
jgi:predicted transposase YbfD/YdcC